MRPRSLRTSALRFASWRRGPASPTAMTAEMVLYARTSGTSKKPTLPQREDGHDVEAFPTAKLLFDERSHRNVRPMNVRRSRGRRKIKDHALHILQLQKHFTVRGLNYLDPKDGVHLERIGVTYHERNIQNAARSCWCSGRYRDDHSVNDVLAFNRGSKHLGGVLYDGVEI